MKVRRKLKGFTHSEISKRFFKIVLFITVVNVLIAILGSYLGIGIPFFSVKSVLYTISNLLFLEGAIILTIGGFLEIGKAYFPWGSNGSHMSLGVFSMMLGASLVGLSVIVGLFFYA